uniref:4-alpha-glucanotransferase n=1 Tax=Candidatus Kentrum sp. LPFa TaxID=2126335 RepID=A0A450WYK3_9GAMM|nr:MAG: 4-alpha-glucanotransferase [Candidatus Kentron sp. LPFa]VFK30634.1 MAG: 4-alpha-glucanotransferase [Candidatus Kentron sp. LPFa]
MKPTQSSARDTTPTLDKRQAGILLHPTSLPGGVGHGDLGPDAYAFVDFLNGAGFRVWQTLPLGPIGPHDSPYSSPSVNGGNTRLISLEMLIARGWLEPSANDLAKEKGLKEDKASFSPEAFAYHRDCLMKARDGFFKKATGEERNGYAAFVAKQGYWLDDYALFEALSRKQGSGSWRAWPADLRDRAPSTIKEAHLALADSIGQILFDQFLFFAQWFALKEYANERGILLFGDMPIFVDLNNASVWANREYFRLDREGTPTVVTGVPPDYFSATGQLWGNPHYDWQRMREDDFLWWRDRFRGHLQLFDLLRVDHFRGFEASWEVPATEKTAMNGHWAKAPGAELFGALKEAFPNLPLIAEDLGVITPEVDALRDGFGFPGMRVLQFGFDGAGDNPHVPHHHTRNSVVYTGTHDNDTSLGWLGTLPKAERERACDYLNLPLDISGEDFVKVLTRTALASVGDLAVLTMQDILGLGSEGRMNTPGVAKGNWRWRFSWEDIPPDLEPDLWELIRLYGRDA